MPTYRLLRVLSLGLVIFGLFLMLRFAYLSGRDDRQRGDSQPSRSVVPGLVTTSTGLMLMAVSAAIEKRNRTKE